MKWRNILIVFLFILASFLAYNYFKQPFVKYFPEVIVEENQLETANDNKFFSIADLTAKEKISQMLMLPLTLNNEVGPEEDKNLALLLDRQPGFIIYFGKEINFNTAEKYHLSLKELFAENNKIMPLLAVDHEGGKVQRLSGEGFTILPSMAQLVDSVVLTEMNSLGDLDYIEVSSDSSSLNARKRNALFAASASELSEVGINLVLAPVVDYSSSYHPILGNRVGNNPDSIIQIAKEYIRAFSNLQIMPVLKHFPGIGQTTKDLHSKADTVSLDKNDALIFEKLLDSYPNLGLMSTHLRLQDKLSGQPCSLSQQCLGEIYKFYPEILMISDDLLMASASYLPNTNEQRSLSEIAISAIEAGNQVIILGAGFDYDELGILLIDLEKKYEDSQEFRSKVDAASKKILSFRNINN